MRMRVTGCGSTAAGVVLPSCAALAACASKPAPRGPAPADLAAAAARLVARIDGKGGAALRR